MKNFKELSSSQKQLLVNHLQENIKAIQWDLDILHDPRKKPLTKLAEISSSRLSKDLRSLQNLLNQLS